MYVPRAIEQNGERRQFVDGPGNRAVVEHIEHAGLDAGGAGVVLQESRIDVGRVVPGAFPRHRDRARAPDTLTRGGDERDFPGKASAQAIAPRDKATRTPRRQTGSIYE